MTAFTLGEATALALARVGTRTRSMQGIGQGAGSRPARTPHRTGAPVRRDSLEAGTFEDLFFAHPAKGGPDRMLRAARVALDAGRRLKRAARAGERDLTAPEQALAAMTAGAVRVFEEICTLARLNAGRVFPSYDRLAQATALGRATVARALAVLEAAGFLVRQRRFKRVDGEGPRYAQTSNVYRPSLPQRLAELLPRWLRPAPLPVDVVQREADRVEEVAMMEATLSARELGRHVAGGPLGRMLARLGAAIDRVECESHDDPQPLLNSFSKVAKTSALSAETPSLTATKSITIEKQPNSTFKPNTGAPATPTHAP